MNLDKNVDNTYWLDNQELNMREFHYISSDLVFVAYYTKEAKLAFVFNNTLDNLHLVKKLIIDPLQSEIDIENPIIKWDQIVKENFNIDPVIIRPKNGNLYEKFDIDYTGLSKYDELVNDPKNDVLKKNLIIFDVKRNLDSAYKKEESVLLELNNSSKTVETTTKTLEKIDVSISNLNKKIEKIETEDVENKEEKQNELNEKLYKKISEQKSAKRRLKRAKSRYVKADKSMESIRLFLTSASDFLKHNKEIRIINNEVVQDRQMVSLAEDKINNNIGIKSVESNKNSDIPDINKSIKTVLSKNFNLPNWRNINQNNIKQSEFVKNKNNNLSNTLDDKIKNGSDIENTKSSHKNENVGNNNTVNDINLSDKLIDIKNKIIEKSIKNNVQTATSSIKSNNLLGRKNRIIIGTLGDKSINPIHKNFDKKQENSTSYQNNLNKQITNQSISKINNEKNFIQNKNGVFRYSSGSKITSDKDSEFEKFKKNLITLAVFVFILLCLISGYFFFVNQSNKSERQQNSNVNVSDSDFPISTSIKDDVKEVKIEKPKELIVNKNKPKVIKKTKPVIIKPVKKSEIKKEKLIKTEEVNDVSEKYDEKTEALIDKNISEIKEDIQDNTDTKNDIDINTTSDDIEPEIDISQKVVEIDNQEKQDNEHLKDDTEHSSIPVDINIADTSLSLSGNSSNMQDIKNSSDNDTVDTSSTVIPNQFAVEGIKYDNNLIAARNNYVSGVIGYLGSVNRPLDIMMALGEAFVNQDNDNIEKYIIEVNKMNDLWNDFRLATFNSYYNKDNYLLKDGIVENEEIYDLFVDDEKLLRSYSDAFQNLLLIVRYMLDNYMDYIDSNLFEQIKMYSSTPEMLGYHVTKTNLIIDAYSQIHGKKAIIDMSELPTNEDVNNLYADKNAVINTKQTVILKNVNNSEDIIETDVMLNNIKPDKEYQIRVGVENKVSSDKSVEAKKEIINLDIESVDGVKGTYILDGVQSYQHSMIVDDVINDVSDETSEKNYNHIKNIDIISISLSLG